MNNKMSGSGSSENFSLDVSDVLYRGRYGPENTEGYIVTSTMRCGGGSSPPQNKEIVFVVDLSGSMDASIPMLKNSLRAFRDVIVDRVNLDANVTEDEVEQRFRDTTSVKVIGYSQKAWLIYSSEESDRTWDQAICNEVYARSFTNMSAGIRLGFEHTDPEKCTWLIIMSDGKSNRGECQTSESFQTLMESTPSNTRVMTLGYGDSFNIKTMKSIGDFTYVENREYIPSVFGSIANEFMNTWGFNVRWKYVCESQGVKYRYVIGNPNIGSLYKDREYTIGVTISNDVYLFCKGEGRSVLTFTCVETMEVVEISTETESSDELIPESIREKYYAAAKGRRLEKLYTCIQTDDRVSFGVLCRKIEGELEKWTEPCAAAHREELIRIMNELSNDSRRACMVVGRSVDVSRQYSNTVKAEFSSSQCANVEKTSEYTSAYTE